MSEGRRAASTLGDVLVSRRQRRFAGRAAEIELFREALDAAGGPPFSALWLHGPGGIGKTSLLEVFAALATGTGATVAHLDGRELHQHPAAVLEALRRTVAVPTDGGPVVAPAGRLVLLLDTYERMAPLDDWIRGDLLPRLPVSALTVITGRTPPNPAWRADPAWRELLRVVSLRNLNPEDARSYLRACGVDAAVHDRLVAAAHGHPLGLSLLADLAARGGLAAVDPLTPDLVGTLLRRFVDAVPSTPQRRALEVCALARVTTEPLLRDALAVDDAHDLFGWLRELSFVESGPDGLLPHELARDALDADLRWRDPDGYQQAFHGVSAHIHGHLRSLRGQPQQRAIFDQKFLYRNLRSVLSPVDWDAWGQHYPEPAGAAHRGAVLELVAAAEGEESAAVAERWLDRQPGGFFVLRSETGAIGGFLGLLDLTAASAEDRAADPGAQAAWDHAHRHAPPRSGEIVTQTRFVIDRDAYQGPSPTLNATPVITLQRYLNTPNLAWDFLTLAEPEPWDDYFAVADLPRAGGADFLVGGRRYGLFCHDFRRTPVGALLELWTERALAQGFIPPPAPRPEVLVLSQQDFADAARQALRDLHRPDLLARNPLLRTRLLREAAGAATPDAATLGTLLRSAVETLRQHPRDDRLLRAVDRTYVQAAATQEAAAAKLGLPFSTYRRHLTQAVARIVAWLWDREVYGGGR